MGFRVRVRYQSGKYTPTSYVDTETLESGAIVNVVKNPQEEVLPDIEFFSLENQLKAGVDMEEVNSKVLRPSKIDGNAVYEKIAGVENEQSDN